LVTTGPTSGLSSSIYLQHRDDVLIARARSGKVSTLSNLARC
jgi:hypothetical protein